MKPGERSQPQPSEGKARRAVELAVLAAVAASVTVNSMVTVLLPRIGSGFHASASALAWVVTGSLIALAVGGPISAVLMHVTSTRGLFLGSLTVLMTGVVAAASAPSLTVLVTARAIQGVGAAAVTTTGIVIIARVVAEPHTRGAAFGRLGVVIGGAQAAGPVVGGLLGQVIDWRVVFVVFAAAVGLVLAYCARWVVSVEGVRATAPQSDQQGARISASFLAAIAVGASSMFALLVVEFVIPLQTTTLNRLDTLEVGAVLMPIALASVVVARIAGGLADRRGARVVALGGCGALSASCGVLSTAAGGSVVVIVFALFGVGTGFAAASVAALTATTHEFRLGHSAATGLHQFASYLGGGFGALAAGNVIAVRGGSEQSWNVLHAATGGTAYADALFLACSASAVATIVALAMARSDHG